MGRPPRISTRRLPDSLRNRLEVASAMAWEALVDTHVRQALGFIRLLEQAMPLEESLPRYLVEVDVGETMAAAVWNRTLVAVDLEPEKKAALAPSAAADEPSGWARFRPAAVVREYRARQRRDDVVEGWIRLALARSEESAIATHVDNAITFAALLDGYLPLDRAISEYVDAFGLVGSRSQAVHQRTMARLADVHLPGPRSL